MRKRASYQCIRGGQLEAYEARYLALVPFDLAHALPFKIEQFKVLHQQLFDKILRTRSPTFYI